MCFGETGIESAEIIKGIVNVINPSCVIAVDALASSSAERLGTTVQLSDTGIFPGSGVGNHRFEISEKRLAYLLFQSVFQRLFQQAL